jgi:hypothetical protein
MAAVEKKFLIGIDLVHNAVSYAGYTDGTPRIDAAYIKCEGREYHGDEISLVVSGDGLLVGVGLECSYLGEKKGAAGWEAGEGVTEGLLDDVLGVSEAEEGEWEEREEEVCGSHF